MKKFFPAFVLFFIAAQVVVAQHSATVAWVASTTSGVTGYNVYRAPCTGTVSAGNCSAEGTFAKIGSTVTPVVTYTDTTVTAGGKYSYYVTSTCPTSGCSTSVAGESVASSHIATVVPQDPPLPPTSPSITTVSRNSTGANITISASYTATPNLMTIYSIMSGNTILLRGTQVNPLGSYVVAWTGKLKPGSTVIFSVCDANNSCDSRMV